MDKKVELLHRRLERERLARKEAERIIEEKSRELYIKNQQLERTTAAERQARKEAEILSHILQAFTSKLDPDEVVANLEAFIESLFGHDGCAIYFWKGDDLRLHSVRGDAAAGKKVGDLITPTTLLNDLKHTGSPILLKQEIDETVAGEWGIHEATATWMVVPMFAHAQGIGCVTLESRRENAFSESAAKIAQALANEAAIALENARLFREVERLSTVDPLTGLHNRRHFNTAAQWEFERSLRYDTPLAAILMDIDHFKRVNDTYGHAAGDSVLVAVARVCMQGIRWSDLHARYGGEEFCFLLPQTDLSEAHRLAERLRTDVADLHFDAGGRSFKVTASFGVSERLVGEDSLEHLLARSDRALYQAKHEGRDQVMDWKPA